MAAGSVAPRFLNRKGEGHALWRVGSGGCGAVAEQYNTIRVSVKIKVAE